MPRCRASRNMLLISARVDGVSVAPAMPSSARAPISISGVVEKAARIDATPNAAAPISSSLRRPIRSPRVPMVIRKPGEHEPVDVRDPQLLGAGGPQVGAQMRQRQEQHADVDRHEQRRQREDGQPKPLAPPGSSCCSRGHCVGHGRSSRMGPSRHSRSWRSSAGGRGYRLTVNLRCVTSGESVTRATLRSVGLMLSRSNRRVPAPSSRGARWMSIWSRIPAGQALLGDVRAADDGDVLAVGRRFRLGDGELDAGHEVEGGRAFTSRSRVSWVTTKHGLAKGGSAPQGSSPVSKIRHSHDPGAGGGEEVADHLALLPVGPFSPISQACTRERSPPSPVEYPSSDMVMSSLTRDIGVFQVDESAKKPDYMVDMRKC